MVADACIVDRRLNGPAKYYACLRNQLAELRNSPGEPDLGRLSAEEKGMVADACIVDRRLNGPAKYYACLRNQLAELRNSPGEPDLGRLSAEERGMVADACIVDRRLNGPAKYYTCLRSQLAELGVPIVPLEHSPLAREPGPRVPKPSVPLKRVPAASPPPSLPSSPSSPSGTQGNKPDSGSSALIVIGLLVFLYLARFTVQKVKEKKCSVCGTRTSNATHICDSCQSRANAEESRRRDEQRREAQRQAQEAWRREAEVRAEEQRRREEEACRRLHTLEDLQRLSGSDFERLIASLFEKDGYTVSSRGGAGDEGIDLVLEIGTSKDVVQCKRWRADIGSPMIREFYGSMMHAGARRGFVITTASFTQSAREFVVGKPITLIDGRHLLVWLNGKRSGSGETASNRGQDVGFNPYEVLGVSRAASKDEIRSAYVNLIARYHPDKVSHLGHEFQAIAKERTLAINRAYEMLTHS